MELAAPHHSPQPASPVSAADIDAVEKALGQRLPPLLTEIYRFVGNGGFGPGYGLTGLSGGATDDLGNDVLTLNADLARKLAISKGTVESLDDLLFSLGISRNYVRVDDQSDKIMESWADGVDNAERRLRTLMQEFGQIAVQGDYRERTRARGQRRRLLEQMQGIIRKYEESLNLRQIGVPDVATLQAMIERIKLEQLADRP